MATLRTIRRRIESVKKTQQITRAMQMVAAAKLRKAQEKTLRARPYGAKLFELMRSLTSRIKPEDHPLLKIREEKRISLLIITADRGLCGAYNLNIVNRALKFISEKKETNINLTVIGKKGIDFFRRRGIHLKREYRNILGNIDMNTASHIAQEIIKDYLVEEIDSVYLVFSQFKSILQQQVIVFRLLPVREMIEEKPSPDIEYIFEPEKAEILDLLLPKYVEYQLYAAILESTASEFASRMTAMDLATRNAKEMIETLTLFYNRARQSTITKELMDIVGGAEALQKQG